MKCEPTNGHALNTSTDLSRKLPWTFSSGLRWGCDQTTLTIKRLLFAVLQVFRINTKTTQHLQKEAQSKKVIPLAT